MKQTLLFFAFLLTISSTLKAQPKVYDGTPGDSLTFSMELKDSLKFTHPRYAEIDTTGDGIWAIGVTAKAFFAGGTGSTRAIMTDTVNTYPTNVNDAFVLKLDNGFNTIVTFKHKYETTAGHDGGIVEFSKDNGTTWENVMGDCYAGPSFAVGILTQNFYDSTDTLNNGEMAFSGTSNGWRTSRLQFFIAIPVKSTGGGNDCIAMDTIQVRFRFVSDDTLENKDGWIIDDLKIENDRYSGIKDMVKDAIKVYPNPSTGIVHFPTLIREEKYTIEISNMMGQAVLKTAYKENIDLRKQPRGIYLYKITDGESIYTGRLQLQ